MHVSRFMRHPVHTRDITRSASDMRLPAPNSTTVSCVQLFHVGVLNMFPRPNPNGL